LRVARLGRVIWTVLAICEDDGTCQVLDFIDGLEARFDSHRKKFRNILHEKVPKSRLGPRDLPPLWTEHLEDEIYQFKLGPKNGQKFRILWFYDGNRTIVVTRGFYKGVQRTPPSEIKRAKWTRETYLEARASGNLIID